MVEQNIHDKRNSFNPDIRSEVQQIYAGPKAKQNGQVCQTRTFPESLNLIYKKNITAGRVYRIFELWREYNTYNEWMSGVLGPFCAHDFG